MAAARRSRLLGDLASGPIINGSNCNSNGNENRDNDHFFCEPAGSELTAVFQAAAADLAGIHTHLVQPYPAPIVSAIGPSGGSRNGGTVVTITGDNFTGAVSVKFGGTNASTFTVLSDTSIRATAPGGEAGKTVDIRVSTPGRFVADHRRRQVHLQLTPPAPMRAGTTKSGR